MKGERDIKAENNGERDMKKENNVEKMKSRKKSDAERDIKEEGNKEINGEIDIKEECNREKRHQGRRYWREIHEIRLMERDTSRKKIIERKQGGK